MKALILAGGRGTRLRPLTHTTNKHLLPIGNEPMIYRVIKDVIDAGIKEIIINLNVGDTSIPDAVNKMKWDAKITYIEQKDPNGMMYPILIAEELLKGDDFVLHAGDNILAGGLNKHIKAFNKSKCDALVLVTKQLETKSFSVYQVKGTKAYNVVEKPQEFMGNLAGTAIYFYRGDAIFQAMKSIKPIDPTGKGKAEYFPPPAHQWMIDNGYDVEVSEITGYWKDTGKPNDLLIANQLVLEKKDDFGKKGEVLNSKVEGDVETKEDSVIENSTIRGPVSIGKNVKIKNSYIGPYTSIGDNSIIENVQIENSIVMGNVKLHNLQTRLDSCLIGWNAEVTEKEDYPKASSLFIGDDSVVLL